VNRIDTHHHAIPAEYLRRLQATGMSAAPGNLKVPEWTPEASLAAMDELGVQTAVLSVSSPGTTIASTPADAAALAHDLNDELAAVVADRPDRFGLFATVPMPHVSESVAEAERALDDLHADGVVLLASGNGTYLGEAGQDPLWEALDRRSAVVFIHPNILAGPSVDGIPPFAVDFLLDTTRAAYLLVRNGIRRKYPNIRFILSHAGGFVPYASHRMAWTIALDTQADPAAVLEDLAGFYFDTALSSSPAALPTLLAFAGTDHVTFGSDFPYAPPPVGALFGRDLEDYLAGDDGTEAIARTNALSLFPRLRSSADAANRG
jgi:predicted TIM-barrel fold metal-dependent hydrolase